MSIVTVDREVQTSVEKPDPQENEELTSKDVEKKEDISSPGNFKKKKKMYFLLICIKF